MKTVIFRRSFMSTIRWDPGSDLMTLRNAMSRVLRSGGVRPGNFTIEIGYGDIPLDMFQTENEIVVKATLPGIRPEDVDVSVTGETLTIKAERKSEKVVQGRDYIRRENRYGRFTRTIPLPVQIDPDKAIANFENGVLSLTLPKSETVKPRQIKVQGTVRDTDQTVP
jgi:HSP20 family protein